MTRKKPDFFIVGAPKCGTTSWYYYLRQHPEIFMPEVKEPNFFGSDLSSPGFIRDEEAYLSLFDDVSKEKRVGEASPWYLYSRRAAIEIKRFSPSSSIIIMLRNPVDMMYSLYSQQVFNGTENIMSFRAALSAEEDRKNGRNVPKGDGYYLVDGLFYREVAKYTEQVRRYLEVFDRDEIHVVIFDDLVNDTPRMYQQTLRFLGVAENFVPEFRVWNSSKRVRSSLLRKILKRPPKILVQLGRLIVPRKYRRSLVKKTRRINTRYEERRPMDSDLRRQLQSDFAGEIRELSELLEIDLSHWLED